MQPRDESPDPLGLHGVVPPTVTAFDEEGEVDIDATVAHAEFVVESGAHGVFPIGTNGEFPLLSDAERRRVIEAVADAVDAPVIAGVGEPGTKPTVDNARHAAAAGVDAVVVITPSYFPVNGEGMVDHYQAVAEAIDIPVYAYQFPDRAGNKLSHSTLSRLADIDGFVGLKDSSEDVPWLARAIDAHPELTFMLGSDPIISTGLDLGCAGVVTAISNAFPELIVDLYEATVAGDRERARTLQSTVLAVDKAFSRGPYMAGVKAALSLRDVDHDVGGLRDPLQTMDAAEREALRSDLEALDLL